MNPFEALEDIRTAYRKYIASFQRFKNPTIRDWVDEKLEEGTLISKGPYLELNRRYLHGDPFDQLVKEGLIHPDSQRCFTTGPDHDKDYVVESDRKKRERLDVMGYRVFVHRHDDDLDGSMSRLRSMMGD